MDDKALIEKLKSDPEGGVRALVSLYGGLTAAVARSVLGIRGFAEADIEAAAARHNALDLLRSRRPAEPLDEASPDPSPGPEEQAESALRRREVLEAVRALGNPDREIVVRKYYLGQSSAQIAKALGLTANNVDSGPTGR